MNKNEMYYSFNGKYPTVPQLNPWKDENGNFHDLTSLSEQELQSLGWYGPINMPPFLNTSYFSHDFIWNKENKVFEAREVSYELKLKRIDYYRFWVLFSNSSINEKLKEKSSISILTNNRYFELMILLLEARINKEQIKAAYLQRCFDNIFLEINLTSMEQAELSIMFQTSGLNMVYNLPFEV